MTRKLNATAASLLGFLHEGPLTGWDLVATAQQRIGDFWSLTQSQVYRELTAMAGAGLIEAGEPGPRDRRPYALTDAGRAAFAEWLEGDVAEEQTRFPLLLVVMFGRHVPSGRLAEVIATHRHIHAQRLALYEKQLTEEPVGEPDPYARATLDFGIRYERAVLGWFDELPAAIQGRN
ncbi:PadR family transcriptional regulator [Kribbella sp. NPDC050124]|uniref:PadR family transcriptional regulator n=1 Tax=Kribbella sp. NPDC050124 TaxID=3364114 RepID=UPI0037A9C10A